MINMSFALSGSDDGIAQAIAYAQARGVLVVAAAGNAGTADVTFPAAYPGVISVSATDPSDSRYPWSSYGGWVNLAAWVFDRDNRRWELRELWNLVRDSTRLRARRLMRSYAPSR